MNMDISDETAFAYLNEAGRYLQLASNATAVPVLRRSLLAMRSELATILERIDESW